MAGAAHGAIGALRAALAVLGWFELSLAAMAMVAVTGVNVVGVTLRYGFNSSLIWSEEISLLLMQIMVFAGAAAMYKARAYVVLDVLFDRFPAGVQYGLSVATWVLAAAFAAVVSVQAFSLYPIQSRSSSFILGFPVFYFTLPLAVAAASIALTSVYHALSLIASAGAGVRVAEVEARTSVLPPIEDGV